MQPRLNVRTLAGKQSPYAIITVGSKTFKSKTATGAAGPRSPLARWRSLFAPHARPRPDAH